MRKGQDPLCLSKEHKVPRGINATKQALKLKADEKENSLTLRLGVKKHILPIVPKILASEEYVFVHVPSQAEILRVTENGLEVVTSDEEAAKAAATFKKGRGSRASRKLSASMPVSGELAAALSKIPPGYKLAFGPDGSPKYVRTRNRRKKA